MKNKNLCWSWWRERRGKEGKLIGSQRYDKGRTKKDFLIAHYVKEYYMWIKEHKKILMIKVWKWNFQNFRGISNKTSGIFFSEKKVEKKSELKNQENKTKVPACPPVQYLRSRKTNWTVLNETNTRRRRSGWFVKGTICVKPERGVGQQARLEW